jgi:hypothetical protein
MRRLLCGLVLLLALGIAGCGDDEDEPAAEQGLDMEVRRQVEAICAEAAPRAAKVLGAESIADFERYGRQAGAVIRDLRRELDPVDPGEAATARWRQWLAAIDADLEAYRLLELAGSVRNREAVLEQNEKLSPGRPAQVARKLGLPGCAEVTNDAANTFDR